jgi:hypothetical protein
MVKFTRELAYQPLDEDLGEIRLLRLVHPYRTALSYFPRGPPYVADCEFDIFALRMLLRTLPYHTAGDPYTY